MTIPRLVAAALLILALTGPAQAETPLVPDEKPLTGTEIKALIDGVTFEVVAYDEPFTAVLTWSFETESVTGSYVWEKTKKGTVDLEMYIENDRLCTRQKKGDVCQIIYRYETGFMEVTPQGVVHAVSLPKQE